MAITIEEIRSVFSIEKPSIILEIGANVGKDTLRFLEAFPNAFIHCFEPDPRCINKFKSNVNSNRCKLYPVALSNKNEEIDFYLSGGNRPKKKGKYHKSIHINSSSIKEPFNHLKKHPWCCFNEVIKVQSTKLDTWAEEQEIEKIDFIWADVQGAEEDLILGGINAINKSRYFYTEFSDERLYKDQISLKDILNLLPSFKIKKCYKTNVLLENIHDK